MSVPDLMIVLKLNLDGGWCAFAYDGDNQVARLESLCNDPKDAAGVMVCALEVYLRALVGMATARLDATPKLHLVGAQDTIK